MKTYLIMVFAVCSIQLCIGQKAKDDGPVSRNRQPPTSNSSENNEESDYEDESFFIYDKLNFGNGYNSTTLKETFGVMEYTNLEESTELIGGASGNTGVLEVLINKDKRVLRKTLNLTFSAKLNLMIKGFSSNNDYKETVYKETKTTKYNENATIKAVYINEPRVLINPKMKAEIIKKAKKDGLSFMKDYGDSFVSKIYTGGEMMAQFEFNSLNEYYQEQNTKWINSVNKFKKQTLSITYDEKETFEDDSTKETLSTNIVTKGGALTPITKLEQLIENAYMFKESVSKYPAIIYVELTPYERLEGFPDIDFKPIRVKQKDYLVLAEDILDRIQKSIDQAEYVLTNPKYFNEQDFENAYTRSREDAVLLDSVLLKTKACFDDFDACLIENLGHLKTYMPFEPRVKYPYNISVEVPLRDEVDKAEEVIQNTLQKGHEYFLTIKGTLNYDIANNNNVPPECLEPVYKMVQYYRGKERRNVPQVVGKKTKSIHIYIQTFRPYYEVIFRNTNNQITRRVKWTGTPIDLWRQHKIEVVLRNPNSVIVGADGGVIRYASPYYNVDFCGDNPPKAVISDTDEVMDENVHNKSLYLINKEGVSIEYTKEELSKPKMIKNGNYWIFEPINGVNKK